MAEINLLPKEKRPKKSLIFNKKLLLIAVCSALFLSCMMVLNLQLNSHLQTAEELRIEIADYNILREEAAELEIHGDLLKEKIQIYSELLEDNVSWGERLENISEVVPHNFFITDLHMEDDRFLLIEGYALALGDIAVFITHLSDSRHYTSVRLHSAVEETRDGITLLRYEIVCGL